VSKVCRYLKLGTKKTRQSLKDDLVSAQNHAEDMVAL